MKLRGGWKRKKIQQEKRRTGRIRHFPGVESEAEMFKVVEGEWQMRRL